MAHTRSSRPAAPRPAAARHPLRRLAVLAAVAAVWGCAGAPLRVSPDEIPTLRAAVGERPDDADLRARYAAALFAGGRCDDARVEAGAAARGRPANGITPLIQGQCLEAEGRLDEAVGVYAGYLRQHPEGEGADAVGGRLLLTQRTLAAREVRAALAREAELADQVAPGATVAVLPAALLGTVDERYRGLAPALAQMLVSDLSLMSDLRLVERGRVDLLLRELDLSRSGAVDPATAARVGRLLRAGQLVQPRLVIDPAAVRLEATLARPGAVEAIGPGVAGELRLLLDLEKRLALALADRLAGPLTPADERRILDNGPQSVDAFLRWADGLILEDEGDYRGAAAAYREAARLDPEFDDARLRARQVAAAAAVIGRPPAEVVGAGRMAARAAARAAAGPPPLEGALAAAFRDVASLGPEVTLGTLPPAAGLLWTPGANQPLPAFPADVLLRILVRIPR